MTNLIKRAENKLNLKITWRNSDGTINGALVTSLISLLIVLAQQVLQIFGINTPVNWDSIVGIINTILTILGLLGVVSNVQLVKPNQASGNVTNQNSNNQEKGV